MTAEQLLQLAKKARENAYTPYSGFRVGAALLCADGRVFTGCNLENGAYSPTLCAERVAFAKALSEGCREFSAMAVWGNTDAPCPPCGVCRQVMQEHCKGDFLVHLQGGKTYTLEQLLPYGFSL